MEQCIGDLDIWDEHGCRVSCKDLEMLNDAYHAQERRRFVVWYNSDESMQGTIGCTILQVEDDKSNGVYDLLDANGTNHSRKAPLAMGADAGGVGTTGGWESYVERR